MLSWPYWVYIYYETKNKVVNIFLFCNKQRKSEECDDEAAKKAKQEEKGAGDAKPNGHAWF